jgi:hypothetical protein
MFLTVFPADVALCLKTVSKARAQSFNIYDTPPGVITAVTCPITKHTPNSRGIATTPIVAAFRAATQTERWAAPPNMRTLSPFFLRMSDEAKNWLMLLKLSTDISFKAFQVDEAQFNDTLCIVSLLCYGLHFNLKGLPDENLASTRAMEILINLPITDASRIRYSLLDFLDRMCDKQIPETIIKHAGNNSRLSTKYAAMALASLFPTVDT